jgi:hypothetical protein
MARWVVELTPAWLQAARTVVRHAAVRLILDLNLITGSPSAASLWARAARADLPSRSIAGFEIGNEPDIYSRSFWITRLSGRGLDAAILPGDLTSAGYAEDFRSYALRLKRVAPSVPLLGPAIANPVLHAAWSPACWRSRVPSSGSTRRSPSTEAVLWCGLCCTD